MSTPLEANRWATTPDQFAVQVQLADVAGYFSKKLVIEPGTRALLIEEGRYLGEVPPGTYTLESFAERLLRWQRKQATVILARQEDVPLEITAENLPTSENLLVQVGLRLTVQMEDVAMFLRNLLGATRQFGTADLRSAIEPVVRQALWEAVGRMGMAELTGPHVRGNIEAAVEQALGVSMRRYGLRFGQVQTVSIRHDQYDAERRKKGEVFLLKEGVAQQKALDEVYTEDELSKVRLQEKENELAVLAQQVDVDLAEGEAAVKLRRIGVRNKLRQAVVSEWFDHIKNEEDLAKMVHEQDTAKLLRDSERQELVAIYRDKQADRESARRHLVAKLDIERQIELDSLRSDLDFASKSKSLDHEMALARRVEAEENRRWLETLQKESQMAQHRRQERDRDLQQQRQWSTQLAGDRREEEWQDVLHQQRMDRLRGDVELVQAERKLRVERMKLEFDTAQREAQRQGELADARIRTQIDGITFDTQLKKIQALELVDRERTRFELDMYERKRRLDTEIKALEDDKSSARELARIQVLRDVKVEALIAASSPEVAARLVDLEKHRASETTKQVASADVEKVRQEARAEQAKLLDRLVSEAEAKAALAAQAYKDAMSMQAQTMQQAFGAMAQVAHGGQPQVTVVPGMGGAPVVLGQPGMVGVPGTTPPAAQGGQQNPRVLVCASCRRENDPAARFCGNCGKPL